MIAVRTYCSYSTRLRTVMNGTSSVPFDWSPYEAELDQILSLACDNESLPTSNSFRISRIRSRM